MRVPLSFTSSSCSFSLRRRRVKTQINNVIVSLLMERG
jgi:hypothetical protein